MIRNLSLKISWARKKIKKMLCLLRAHSADALFLSLSLWWSTEFSEVFHSILITLLISDIFLPVDRSQLLSFAGDISPQQIQQAKQSTIVSAKNVVGPSVQAATAQQYIRSETSFSCPMDYDMSIIHNCITGEIESVICRGTVKLTIFLLTTVDEQSKTVVIFYEVVNGDRNYWNIRYLRVWKSLQTILHLRL